MEIRLDRLTPFSLDVTLCCGQVFLWDNRNGWWYGVARDRVFKIRQIGDVIEFENADAAFVKDCFGLHDDLPNILKEIARDEHIERAVQKFRGLRIVRQDPWECLVSYICATYKNIPAIRRMLFGLCRKFGEKISFEGDACYTFPKPEQLRSASLRELAECGLGYRAKYVSEAAKMFLETKFDSARLRRMPYEEARQELLVFPGVGLKVADCVLLFSLGKLEAFPVDVWIKRSVLKHYRQHFPEAFDEKIATERALSTSAYKLLNSFGRNYFGHFAGYAQEYLYHYERMLG